MTPIEQASKLGKQAFLQGKSSTPIQDKELVKLISENPDKTIGASTPIIDAWIKSWHKANVEYPFIDCKK